jgi:hypothetical protein
MSKILCNLCGAESYQIVFKPRRGKGASASSGGERPERILKCNTCGLIFAEQSLSREFYERKYIDKVDALSAREEKGRRRAYSKMLDKIERIKPKGSILRSGQRTGYSSMKPGGTGGKCTGRAFRDRSSLREERNLTFYQRP